MSSVSDTCRKPVGTQLRKGKHAHPTYADITEISCGAMLSMRSRHNCRGSGYALIRVTRQH